MISLVSRGVSALFIILVIAAGGTAVVSSAASQDAFSTPAKLGRITLVVSDIERSAEFYQRVGLSIITDISRTNSDPAGVIAGSSLPLTADPARSRIVVLSGGDGTAEISLLWYDRPPLPSARGNLMGVGTGDVLLMFEVADIDYIYDRLDAVGTRFPEPRSQFASQDGSVEERSGFRFLAYDPDGNMVEVVQFD